MSTDPAAIGRRGGAARAVGFALLAAWAGVCTVGCLDQPTDSTSGGSAVGGWELSATAGCIQHLAFAADGTFSLSSRRSAGMLSSAEQVQGTVTTSGGGLHGHFAARFTPDIPLASGSAAYCADWAQSPPVALPFAAASARWGPTPWGSSTFPASCPAWAWCWPARMATGGSG